MAEMRDITLEESRAMSLKLEELLSQETRITERKSALSRENRVEMDRCLEEQERVRQIIRTGQIDSETIIQEELFDGDEISEFNVTINFISARSGIPICEIPLQDMSNFRITPEVKSSIKTAVNNVLFEVKQEALGYIKSEVFVYPAELEGTEIINEAGNYVALETAIKNIIATS